uniref:AAA+ ATPase domain-containing protein n=1 Tax=Ditylenchus dipsaci TaxID=166011 RepID=A0A915E1C1_9BILA
MAIFGTKKQLNIFRCSKTLICDGFFKYRPQDTYQIYREFGFIKETHCLPFVTVQMRGKSRKMDEKMWKKAESYHSRQQYHFRKKARLGVWIIRNRELHYREEIEANDILEGQIDPDKLQQKYAEVIAKLLQRQRDLVDFLLELSTEEEYKKYMSHYMKQLDSNAPFSVFGAKCEPGISPSIVIAVLILTGVISIASTIGFLKIISKNVKHQRRITKNSGGERLYFYQENDSQIQGKPAKSSVNTEIPKDSKYKTCFILTTIIIICFAFFICVALYGLAENNGVKNQVSSSAQGIMDEIEEQPSFYNNNGEKESKRKRRRSSGIEARILPIVKPQTFSEQIRLKKPILPKKQSTLDRFSFSFERASHLQPIIRPRRQSSNRPKIMNSARRLLFRKSKDVVIDITPLVDKPIGVVRMPEDTEINDDITEGPCIDETGDNSMFSRGRSPIEITPIALNFSPYERVNMPKAYNSSVAKLETTFDWSVEEEAIFERASLSGKNTIDRQTKLWTSVFGPADRKDFFGNAAEVEKFYSWLETWKKRFSWQVKSKLDVHQRRRKKAICEDTEYIEKKTTNPFVIAGPCGSGKTSTVHCAAKEKSIRVLEFSSADRRNGSALEEKLAGAIENHNVNKERKVGSIFGARCTPTLNPMLRSVESPSSSLDFSLVLIDDCDIIYSSDERFWSALKSLCSESKIPIVLTCSNPAYVKRMLQSNPSVAYESIHFKLPTSISLARHLRPWICGYSNKLLTISWLRNVIEEHNCDLRATLNAIQSRLSSGLPGENARPKVAELQLETHLSRVSVLCSLDAAYGRSSSTTWRGKLSMDFDFIPDRICQYQQWTRDSAELEEPVQSILQPYIKDTCLGNFPPLSGSNFQPSQPVKDAWQRSSTMIHSCKVVAMDYLPTLCALDDRFYRKAAECRNQRRTSGRCRTQHPFDATCRKSGLSIDKNQRLKHSISKYSFSACCEPRYSIQ